MIIANKATIAKHGVLADHFRHEMALRREYNAQQARMADLAQFDPVAQAVNAAGVYGPQAWLAIDQTAAEVATSTRGTEIYQDLQALVTPLPLGKTVRVWNNVGNIHNEVAVSMDGQSPIGADQVSMSQDADPIPLFTARFGVNYRHELANRTEMVPLIQDSQTAKMDVYMAALAGYVANGSANISEAGFKGEGLKNHRNTEKLDLGTSGFNVNLTTANEAALMKFFTVDLSGVLDDNNVQTIDLWVSKEVRANLSNDAGIVGIDQTVEQRILKRNPRIASIRTAYNSDVPGFSTGLTGNEILAYVKSKSFIEMLVGQAIQIVPVPRLELRANFNFDISSALGVQIKRRGANSGVFFGASLT